MMLMSSSTASRLLTRYLCPRRHLRRCTSILVPPLKGIYGARLETPHQCKLPARDGCPTCPWGRKCRRSFITLSYQRTYGFLGCVNPDGMCANGLARCWWRWRCSCVCEILFARTHLLSLTNFDSGVFYFFGGMLQVMGAVMEWLLGNTFISVVFASYGAFWLTFGSTLTPSYNALGAYINGLSGAELKAAQSEYYATFGKSDTHSSRRNT